MNKNLIKQTKDPGEEKKSNIPEIAYEIKIDTCDTGLSNTDDKSICWHVEVKSSSGNEKKISNKASQSRCVTYTAKEE